MQIKLCVFLILLGIVCAVNAEESAISNQRMPGTYSLSADSLEQAGIKRGKLEGPFEFHSAIFENTVKRYWIYVPVKYNPKKPPNLLVFQDGQRAINPKGSLRIPIVLDNLIHKGDIPVTLGIFITPGNLSEHYPDTLNMDNPDNRAFEYDSLSDAYSRFLIDELLPEVAKRYRFSENPKQRIIGGTSSGAICAFTVGWHKPESFGNVISMIGSYTSIGYRPANADLPMQAGGDLYPGIIRKNSIRPLRIFLQDGSNDINNEHGDWFLANQQMLSALKWANANADKSSLMGARYDIKHIWGDGGHSDQHGGVLLPDMLRWFWQDHKAGASK